MNYGLVAGLKEAYPVSQWCEVLAVQKSSYYYWQAHRQPTAARLHLQVQVKAIDAEVNHVYGSRRMSTALKMQGLNVGRYQARSLMQQAHVIAIQPKKKPTYPADVVSCVADNRLNREFEARQPNQKWVGDMTYLWTATGWMYLAGVLDLFSRKVIGWHLSNAPDTALILAALNQAVILRKITPHTELLFHSDQGCQYTRHVYQDRLADLGINARMSRRGHCWDNAVMERFFRSLKVESISRDYF